jgi:hypothetical protein
MTVKHKTNEEDQIETLLKAAQLCQIARDLAGAQLMLEHADDLIKKHIGDEKITPHLLHADYHLHMADLYLKLGRSRKTESYQSALEGLSVVTAICKNQHKNPVSDPLWEQLMNYIAH